jgi:sugar phosphate isomerase/epimerase
MKNPLSINAYICPPDYPIARFLPLVAQTGASSVGLTIRALDEIPVPQLKARLNDLGLGVSTLNSAGYFLYHDVERSAQQTSTNLRLIDAAAELAAQTLVVITGGLSHGTASLRDARGTIADGLHRLAERAASAGVHLGLEPIHPAGVLNKGCVNSLRHALSMVSDIHNASLALDLYHSWWDPDLPDLIRNHGSKIRVVQFCNVVALRDPADLQRESPEVGLLDVGAELKALSTQGYSGTFEYELFAEHLRGRDVEPMIAQAAKFYAGLA